MAKIAPTPIPRFETPIIETHCHLDYLDGDGLESVLTEAAEVGVERFVTIAVSPDNLATVRALVDHDTRIWGTQGIHPHEAVSWNNDVGSAMVEGLGHPRILAVGEIGLDYHYDHSDRRAQARAFEAQLQLAVDHDLPVVIHTREADDHTRAILTGFLPSLRRRGVIHSFTSGMALAEFCLANGFDLGFNGITTFRNADNVRAVVAMTPVEQLLLETDSPYLTPVPYRGRVNSPKYLPFIAETIADLKALPVEVLLAQAHANSTRVFGFTDV